MLRKSYTIKQIRIVPAQNLTDPDGNPMPDEWRVNIYYSTVIDDDEDELFEPVRGDEVEVYTEADLGSAPGIPEIAEVIELVFGPTAAFAPGKVKREEVAERGRKRPVEPDPPVREEG